MLEVVNEYADVRKHSKDSYGYVRTPPPPIRAVPRKQLNAEHDKEELARLREMSDAQLGQHRLPGQEDFKDQERQLGKPMHSNELIKKVLKINKRLVCEDSVNCPGHAGFYRFTRAGNKKPTNAHFKKGILPEFSVIETDAADLPVRVQYGWREVLLRLVKAKQLSLTQVLRAFGDTDAAQSAPWRRNVQQFRN